VNIHPLAELIPGMTDAEFADLKADIAANGQREAITIYEGMVLDGRHRYRACEELGIESFQKLYEGDSPATFVISLNVKRRSLNPSQRAAVAVEFLPELEKEARKRQGERTDLTSGATAPQVDSKDPHRARNDAGALVGVSGSHVDRAKRIKEQAPERFEDVKRGDVSVRRADEELVRARKAENAKPDFEVHNERHRRIAETNKLRVEKAVGTAMGMTRGFPHLKVSEAAAVSSDEEIDGWIRAFDEAIRTIRQLKKQLEGIQ